MKDKYPPCFEIAFEKLNSLDQERSISGFNIYKSNLEKMLYLSIGDYNNCLKQYGQMLEIVEELTVEKAMSRESLKDILEKIENVAEMIMLLNGLKNVDVRDINYAGDNKGGMFNEAKELTDKCFDKTISLTGKIENIMDSYDIMDLTEEIIEEEALEFKEDEPNKGLKEYKTDLEKLWHENPNSLALQLNDLIGRSRKVRGGNKILKKETYEKLLIYKKNIEELPSPNGNNSDLYRTLENLKYKTVVELDMLFVACKVGGNSYADGMGEIELKETFKPRIENVEEIKIKEPLYKKSEESKFDKKKSGETKPQKPKEDKNKPWYYDRNAKYIGES